MTLDTDGWHVVGGLSLDIPGEFSGINIHGLVGNPNLVILCVHVGMHTHVRGVGFVSMQIWMLSSGLKPFPEQKRVNSLSGKI